MRLRLLVFHPRCRGIYRFSSSFAYRTGAYRADPGIDLHGLQKAAYMINDESSTYCQNCISRSFCQSECPELSLHLKEYEKAQRELTVSNLHYSRKFVWPSGVILTKTEKKVATYLATGVRREEIAKMLNIKRKTLREIISRLKKKATLLTISMK